MSKKKVNQNQQNQEIKENQQIGKDQPETKEKKKRRNPLQVMRDSDKKLKANHPVIHKGLHIGGRIIGGTLMVLGAYSGTAATVELVKDRKAKREALNLTSPAVPEIPMMDIPQIPVTPVADSADTMTTESEQ